MYKRQAKYSVPYTDPFDSEMKRLQYVRYADDFIIGVIGSKQDAATIKEAVKTFLSEQLCLEMSDEKTLITHANSKARFLGYDIFVRNSQQKRRAVNGVLQRTLMGTVCLEMPMEIVEKRLLAYGAMTLVIDKYGKEWSDTGDGKAAVEADPLSDTDAGAACPEAFRKATRLSQHIAYLKDFFRVYKDFNDAQIDALEILLTKLYSKFGIYDNTDYDKLKAEDYPVMADLYGIVESEYLKYEKGSKSLFTEDLLRELCLGLNSMCVGAESKFFNGHTNITDDKFSCFGVKGLMDANKKLKDAMLFNILSYMNHKLLTKGRTAASIDELYLFLTNLTAIEYIRNAMKRVRKKESSIILASQNIEDFLLPEIKEFTKPLFSIPTHQFLFNGGNINAKDYIDALQLEESEFDLIKYPERGTCLFKCGNERYLLQVKAPEYKAKLFGEAGGR